MATLAQSGRIPETRSLKQLRNTLFYDKVPLSKEDFRFIAGALLIEAKEIGGLQENKIKLEINFLKFCKKIHAIKERKERSSLQEIWIGVHGKSTGIPALAGINFAESG